MQYHSDPLLTKRILSSKVYSTHISPYGAYSPPTEEQIIDGAFQSSSNPKRKAFFIHAWVVTGQIAGWLFVLGLVVMMLSIIFNPWQPIIGMVIISAISFIASCSLTGVTCMFYYKIEECVASNEKLVLFTKQELLRPSLIGGFCGLVITIFLYWLASYAATQV